MYFRSGPPPELHESANVELAVGIISGTGGFDTFWSSIDPSVLRPIWEPAPNALAYDAELRDRPKATFARPVAGRGARGEPVFGS
jgi:hypothetical protein